MSKAGETSGFIFWSSKFVFNLTLESLRGLIVYPAGWMFVALGLDMCGTNENAGMPIMEIPFTINSRRHRPHLPQNAAQASGLIQHSGLLGGGRVIFDPIFFCQFFASLVLFIHISFRKNMFGNIYVKKNSKFWSQKVLKKAILHCKNG